jgi:hypothetical protein
MITSLAIILFGAAIFYLGVDFVKKEKDMNVRKAGGIFTLVGFILVLTGVVLYPYLNIWESGLAGKASLARAEFEVQADQLRDKCVSCAKLEN